MAEKTKAKRVLLAPKRPDSFTRSDLSKAIKKVAAARRRQFLERIAAMVVITFPDKETQKKALGFLLGRLSGKVLKNGEHLVPEAALAALADQNISFTVHGRA